MDHLVVNYMDKRSYPLTCLTTGKYIMHSFKSFTFVYVVKRDKRRPYVLLEFHSVGTVVTTRKYICSHYKKNRCQKLSTILK